MFFIGIFGFSTKSKKISEIDFKCTGCLNDKVWLYENYKSFDLFFIPLYKFNKSYVIHCSKCGSIYKLKNEVINKILSTHTATYEDVERIICEVHICSKCGAGTINDYSFCPKCGNSLKK